MLTGCLRLESDAQVPVKQTPTPTLGEVMGLDVGDIRRMRKQLRKELRKRYRLEKTNEASPAKQRERAAKLAKRWQNVGIGNLPKGGQTTSLETDGVGLRICIKYRHDIKRFIRPIEEAPSTGQVSKSKPKQQNKSKDNDEKVPDAASLPPGCKPIFAALDNGRVKLHVAAINKSGYKEPSTCMFTKKQYYYEMKHGVRKRWEQDRVSSQPMLKAVLDQLSTTNGLGNCDPESWDAYLSIDAQHAGLLEEEYIKNIDRALWKMRMFRLKRRSLDRGVQTLMTSALKDEPIERPFAFAVGNAGFPCNGKRGELPAPTAQLTLAYKRALNRVARTGRKVFIYSLDEYNTTKCCCACGSETVRPIVTHRYNKLMERL